MGITHGWTSADTPDSSDVTPTNFNDHQITLPAAITVTIANGTSVVTTGVKTDCQVPFDGTITSWSLMLDASGSIVIDIWKDTMANFPPTDADSITASAPPTVSSDTDASSSTLTGWTTSISTGDVLRFNVDSASTCTRAVLTLFVTRTT